MRASRVSPIWLVLFGILSVQFGAGIAKTLFDEVAPTTIVWLRLATSAVVLLAIARPALRGRTGRDWLVVVAFGLILGLMNWSIYQSFARIPIGLAVTLEFVGPLTLAVLGSRRARDLIWVGLAGLGVLLLGLQPGDLTWAGVGFALLAGGCWAAYILLSAQTGRRWQGIDGLAIASVVATLLLTPLALGRYADQLADARILVIGALVGLLSSVIPYTCELVALRTLRPAVFSILMSLEPAAAALAGLVVVHELLGPVQLAGHGVRGGRERRRHPVRRDHLRSGAGLILRELSGCFSPNCSRTLYKGVMTRGGGVANVGSTPLPPGPESHHDPRSTRCSPYGPPSSAGSAPGASSHSRAPAATPWSRTPRWPPAAPSGRTSTPTSRRCAASLRHRELPTVVQLSR